MSNVLMRMILDLYLRMGHDVPAHLFAAPCTPNKLPNPALPNGRASHAVVKGDRRGHLLPWQVGMPNPLPFVAQNGNFCHT